MQQTYIIISSESLTACGATRVIASAAATTDTVINYLSVLAVSLWHDAIIVPKCPITQPFILAFALSLLTQHKGRVYMQQ